MCARSCPCVHARCVRCVHTVVRVCTVHAVCAYSVPCVYVQFARTARSVRRPRAVYARTARTHVRARIPCSPTAQRTHFQNWLCFFKIGVVFFKIGCVSFTIGCVFFRAVSANSARTQYAHTAFPVRTPRALYARAARTVTHAPRAPQARTARTVRTHPAHCTHASRALYAHTARIVRTHRAHCRLGQGGGYAMEEPLLSCPAPERQEVSLVSINMILSILNFRIVCSRSFRACLRRSAQVDMCRGFLTVSQP